MFIDKDSGQFLDFLIRHLTQVNSGCDDSVPVYGVVGSAFPSRFIAAGKTC